MDNMATKTIEFPVVELMSVLCVHCERDAHQKVGIFFEHCGLEYFPGSAHGPCLRDTQVSIPVRIYDTSALIKMRFDESLQSKTFLKFWKSEKSCPIFCNEASPNVIFFYNHSLFSKTSILTLCKDAIQVLNPIPDNVLLLFIGIKDDHGSIETKEKRELSEPNVKFVEWCVNSNPQESMQILQDFAKMGLIKEYVSYVKILQSHGTLYKDDGFQMLSKDVPTNGANWSLCSDSLFSLSVLRSLDLFTAATSYNAWFGLVLEEVLIIWKYSTGYSDPLLSLCNHTDYKACYFAFDHHIDDALESAMYDALNSSVDYQVSIAAMRLPSDFITDSFKSQGRDMFVRNLVILICHGVLDLTELLLQFKSLHHLVIERTCICVTNLVFPTLLCETLNYLVLVSCHLQEVPKAVGSLVRLKLLNISDNSICALPLILGNLKELRIFLYRHCPLEFPPKNVLKKSAQEVITYLRAFQNHEDSVPLNEAKLIVVGQDGVGKSTLVKAMQRDVWMSDIKPPDKTDGVDIKTISLDKTRFLVYDLAGDVEYLNTHPLFLSSQCLHLAVFDISKILLGKGNRTADHLCRLELWLNMIAAQHPKSYVIIVGTHADHPTITPGILASVRKQIVELMTRYKSGHKEYFDKCILCNTKLMPQQLQDLEKHARLDEVLVSESCIPHILGYSEVSCTTKYPPVKLSLTNKNLQFLKSEIVSSNFLITNKECRISKTWLSFYENLSKKGIRPTVTFSEIVKLAEESEVPSEMVESMLRFFHSQGNFLWYEDIPEMREIVITDPQWMSNQLRTLISYRCGVNAICEGILNIQSLPDVWPDLDDEHRQKLLVLFRSVGLCFSISEDKEMFPCNLPIGWPDRNKWPSLPSQDEAQTSLLFIFSFLPPTLFSKVIVEVNKKRDSFPLGIEPLYFRFHILYVTQECDECEFHTEEPGDLVDSDSTYHKVHYEITPHNNSLKVSIRGPFPCCFVSDVCSIIHGVQSNSYPGITVKTQLICPKCELSKVADPSTFELTSSNDRQICSTSWHDIGSINDILRGKYSPPPLDREDIRRIVGETLEDFHCPKLFVILPINTNSLSLRDRIVCSYFKDGYALHLLCECPEQWHLVNSPGYRIDKTKHFLKKYGKHLCTVMKAIGVLGIPLRAATAVDPICTAGAAAASGVSSMAKELEGFLDSAFDRYLHLKPASSGDLRYLETSSGLKRSELAKFLETVTKGREFGPLVFTYVDKYGKWFWLCEEHSKRFAIVNR